MFIVIAGKKHSGKSAALANVAMLDCGAYVVVANLKQAQQWYGRFGCMASRVFTANEINKKGDELFRNGYIKLNSGLVLRNAYVDDWQLIPKKTKELLKRNSNVVAKTMLTTK